MPHNKGAHGTKGLLGTLCALPFMQSIPSENVVDLLLDAVCVVHVDSTIEFVSPAFERIFGYAPEEVIGTRMFDLVRTLGELARPFGAWVRLHYVYPYPHVDEIVPLMAEGLVLPYLDVPFQHSHPDVLKRMKRPASGEKNLERIQKWREVCPQLVIRSTFIAGFPGETEDGNDERHDQVHRSVGPGFRVCARQWREQCAKRQQPQPWQPVQRTGEATLAVGLLGRGNARRGCAGGAVEVDHPFRRVRGVHAVQRMVVRASAVERYGRIRAGPLAGGVSIGWAQRSRRCFK